MADKNFGGFVRGHLAIVPFDYAPLPSCCYDLWMRFLLVLSLLTACAARIPAPVLAPPENLVEVEKNPMPPNPETEDIGSATGEWVVPIEAGSCLNALGPCPALSGIEMGEAKAARFGLYKIRYRELRTDFESSRDVWTAQRSLYAKKLDDANHTIQDMQPGWWDRNKGQIGTVGGFVLGTLFTVSIVYVTR